MPPPDTNQKLMESAREYAKRALRQVLGHEPDAQTVESVAEKVAKSIPRPISLEDIRREEEAAAIR